MSTSIRRSINRLIVSIAGAVTYNFLVCRGRDAKSTGQFPSITEAGFVHTFRVTETTLEEDT
ncbi:hypothetical protein SFHH103_04950 (plasmid) [Sinorhizobium fredii HH103]|uniref:Uncharacterized protein n=1 Tax=Sinorhizobium fredii (strain HH103) TaxID=1117943 RepID=G9AED4_SINF1|nr:hypothetical protein SFHH103_04950 [Sinorhizobium fredii HH103]